MLSGFDRLVFRGTLRPLAHAAGMQHYLSSNDVLLKHFGRRSTDTYDFDLVLNSGLLLEEACADVILSALNGKQDAFEGDSRLA